ncbi:hypothetical protein RHSIM_Rhsim01G0034800 [Rhododendron simsii]|uniref:BTB domain-containing protein n=1 Tax=Rhododendron simsii TaxID=118357 RepID=A0A834HKS8_RHOSS|nr:hypothetical protein RHSIM_Rhsim01G0034800 [Rhododendron simsii]
MANQKDKVKFNVGGKTFETTASTFAVAGRSSFFGALFDENWNLQPDHSNEYFINRDPDCFGVLLNLLRTGKLYIPSNIPEKLIYDEALFYGLLDHVRSAKWGTFDGNRLRFSQSITNYAADVGTVIRASPHGGCCVAHGNVVHVYDWMLEEHPPVNLDYLKVNDVGWIDEETFAVSTSERQGGGGGMGLFSASTGELRHRFQFTCWDQLKGYTASALCSSSDKIFSSCKRGDNENGICVWDKVTGKQIDLYQESFGSKFVRSLGNADRLQWLHGTNCLMVASLTKNQKDCSLISLWDVRVKNKVWNWSDSFRYYDNSSSPYYHHSTEMWVRDVIAMEEVNSICVANQYEEFGFLDLRSPREVRSVKGLRKYFSTSNESKVKLALHDGQLFLLTGKKISVFCGPDWELTSRLQRPDGAAICDISLGGVWVSFILKPTVFHSCFLLLTVEDEIADDAYRGLGKSELLCAGCCYIALLWGDHLDCISFANNKYCSSGRSRTWLMCSAKPSVYLPCLNPGRKTVKFNVGGKTFETTATTFAVAGRNSFFGALFDENWNLQPDQSNEYFIDRDPDCFGVLLNLLRTGELCTPHHIPEKLLYREAMFYGLLDHVRSAKWGPFEGNRLHLSQSITNYAAAFGTVIRASPHGGCCVAHSNVVHVYDWMLEEHPPVNLDFQKVNDVGWIDEETFVVGASERHGGGGGMGLFSASTGERRHRFQVTCWDQLKGYTAGALCSSSDKIFSCCKSGDYENGIYVWDEDTGKLIDCYEEPSRLVLGWSLGNADRLQWLPGTNCLMVASLTKNEEDYSLIFLWDVRVKKEVWNWSDSFRYSNGSGDGYFSRETMSNESKVKLALHDGQLVLLTGRIISVFCSPDWELASRLQRPDGAAICDISLGGDRLFALPKEGNVFDIWETPRSPIV